MSMSEAITEGRILDALDAKHTPGPRDLTRWIGARHVRNAAGFSANRTFDYVAIDTWESKHLAVHVYEVKVSRGDWLRELRDPDKTAAALAVADHFSVVAPRDVVKLDELPASWGLIEFTLQGALRTVRAARRLTPTPVRVGGGFDQETQRWTASRKAHAPLDRSFTVAFLRALDRRLSQAAPPVESSLGGAS
jgi:hypothetical protein